MGEIIEVKYVLPKACTFHGAMELVARLSNLPEVERVYFADTTAPVVVGVKLKKKPVEKWNASHLNLFRNWKSC